MLRLRYRACCTVLVAALALGALYGCGAAGTTGAGSLAGTRWNLAAIEQGSTTQPPVAGTQPTLQFGADGTVSGHAGCNSFGGTYTVSGQALLISDLTQTLMGCDAPILDQEQRYTAALQSIQSVSVTETQLILATSQATLRFVRG
jgi:heat shock protein HslJ